MCIMDLKNDTFSGIPIPFILVGMLPNVLIDIYHLFCKREGEDKRG